MTMEFRLLGPVEASIDGRAVDLGPARQRCVLTALLVGVTHVVSVDQLVERVWGDHPPNRARNTLYSYLSRLRRALAGKENVGIARRSGGYLLVTDPAAVDLHRFHNLVAHARTTDDDEHATALYRQALRLWRGDAFATLDTPWLNRIRTLLHAEQRAAELDYNDLHLRLGWPGDLLPDLAARAAEHPLDERLAGQLMLALYRAGRQADALTHYRQIQSRLADEVGTDPGPRLRELHQHILTANPTLTPPPPYRGPNRPGHLRRCSHRQHTSAIDRDGGTRWRRDGELATCTGVDWVSVDQVEGGGRT